MTNKTSHHGSHAPNIGACAPFGSEYDFWGAILSSLNVIGEVVVDPAGVAEISDFDRDDVSKVFVFVGGRRAV
jgi:hypothetical protein